MISEKQIIKNWEKFLMLIDEHLTGKRKDKLLSFYSQFEERISLMPASSKKSYHNAFPGGYVDHVIRVVENSLELAELWKQRGANIDFTIEELVFVALNHDLGKFGSFEFEEFIDNDSDWHVKRGEIYKHNPDLSFMKVSDRSIFLLQSMGIKMTENEYLGIKLHDGLYEESNKSYYIAFSADYRLRSNLPYIIHQADLMSTRIESK